MPNPAPEHDLLLRAARGEHTPRTPVWLMRQAGRYDPEYQRIRSASGLELEDLFCRPDYAAEITILPLRLGVDALILYQDILTPLGPLGAPFVFRPGPLLETPVRTPADVKQLEPYEVSEELWFVPDSIHRVLDETGRRVPLIGFAGAPWTLAAFLIEGQSPGATGAQARSFLQDHPEAAHELLGRLSDLTAAYLRMQIDAGVHIVQLFESCADLLTDEQYETFALPYQQRVFDRIGDAVPRIIFAKAISNPDLLRRSGAEVLSLSEQADLAAARRDLPPSIAVQGNVDNQLLLNGPPEAIDRAVFQCLEAGGGQGHILNLGHGILKGTPFEHVVRFINAARQHAESAAR